MAARKTGVARRTKMALRVIREADPNFDPLREMMIVVKDHDVDVNVRVGCMKELAKYMYPQLKAMELTGEDGGAIKTRHRVHITFGGAD